MLGELVDVGVRVLLDEEPNRLTDRRCRSGGLVCARASVSDGPEGNGSVEGSCGVGMGEDVGEETNGRASEKKDRRGAVAGGESAV